VLLQIFSSVSRENEDFGMAEECISFLKKKRKGLPNQIITAQRASRVAD
jgi:hypothetical protein